MISERKRTALQRNIALATAARSANAAARRVTLTCENCGTMFDVSPSRAKPGKRLQRFCSKPCRYQFMQGEDGPNAGGGDAIRGERNPLWKGGVPVDERTRQPHIAEIAAWRRRVFRRDRFTCQRCGQSPQGRSHLRAHHIAPWSTHPSRRFDLDNGLTLCRTCHDWVHSKANVDREFLI